MKKVIVLCTMLLATVALKAQGPAFTWEKTTHDFGKFKSGEVRETTFSFTNSGDKPLVIYKASASCGCTKATWTKEPIKPGGTGTIVVTYDSKDKPYPFQKSIWVMSNASNGGKSNVELTIKGVAE